jgi:hypothetical protein
MFRPFINGIPEIKRLPKTSYKNLSEMQQNSDDTEECEVPQPEYPCPLIEEPNSERGFRLYTINNHYINDYLLLNPRSLQMLILM